MGVFYLCVRARLLVLNFSHTAGGIAPGNLLANHVSSSCNAFCNPHPIWLQRARRSWRPTLESMHRRYIARNKASSKKVSEEPNSFKSFHVSHHVTVDFLIPLVSSIPPPSTTAESVPSLYIAINLLPCRQTTLTATRNNSCQGALTRGASVVHPR